MARIQKARPASVGTPLGEDVLLLRSFDGVEQLGRPFRYELELYSENMGIDFSALLGEPVSIRYTNTSGSSRYFNGYAVRFEQTGSEGRLHRYRAVVVPWIWLLTRKANCRIFQEKTTPQIVEDVFGEYGQAVFDKRLGGQYAKREYCVQYRETDFDFVSRLLEEEGIYYFFEHQDGKHTLVLADNSSAHDAYPGYDEIVYRPKEGESSGEETIWDWKMQQQVQPLSYALCDYDFTVPGKKLDASSEVSRDYGNGYEIFDYPGRYVELNDGKRLAKVRVEEMQSQFEQVRGEGDAQGISPGCKFNLSNHPRADQCSEYLVTEAHYLLRSNEYDSSASSDEAPVYTCAFTGIRSNMQFRAPRQTPRPVVHGPQTAIVVGKAGEEISTDKFGRVKVHFHWDRYDSRDEKSSCWIRVAQSWAGKLWGAMQIPRIGQEVVVEFLEGDPDRPIITGSVYNGEQMPPYALPGEMTKSTLKSNSTKGGSGFNEIRFEDKAGQEQVFLHAQRNQDIRVKNDCMETIENNRNMTVDKNQMEQVKGNKNLSVGGSQFELIGGDLQQMVKANEDLIVKKKKTEEIGGDYDLRIKGDRNEKVDGTASLTAANKQEKVSMNQALDAGMEIHLKAGMKVIVEAGLQLTLKGSGGFVDIGPAGVTIQGVMVKINSGGAAGSGSGAKPKAPSAPKEAKPTAPAAADDAKTGNKSS